MSTRAWRNVTLDKSTSKGLIPSLKFRSRTLTGLWTAFRISNGKADRSGWKSPTANQLTEVNAVRIIHDPKNGYIRIKNLWLTAKRSFRRSGVSPDLHRPDFIDHYTTTPGHCPGVSWNLTSTVHATPGHVVYRSYFCNFSACYWTPLHG